MPSCRSPSDGSRQRAAGEAGGRGVVRVSECARCLLMGLRSYRLPTLRRRGVGPHGHVWMLILATTDYECAFIVLRKVSACPSIAAAKAWKEVCGLSTRWLGFLVISSQHVAV